MRLPAIDTTLAQDFLGNVYRGTPPSFLTPEANREHRNWLAHGHRAWFARFDRAIKEDFDELRPIINKLSVTMAITGRESRDPRRGERKPQMIVDPPDGLYDVKG